MFKFLDKNLSFSRVTFVIGLRIIRAERNFGIYDGKLGRIETYKTKSLYDMNYYGFISV